MTNILYELKNGKVTETDLDKNKTGQGSYYLNVSSMFDDVTPMKTTEKPIVSMDGFIKTLKMKDYKAYSLLVNKLMYAVLTAKDINDLTNMDKSNSFYNIITSAYKDFNKNKIYKFALDNSNEYIATLARLSIRYYVDDFYNNMEDVSKIEKKEALDALKVSNKRISSLKTRLNDDQKLNTYICNLYNEGLRRLSFDSKGHKCFKCHCQRTTDCPKLMRPIDEIALTDPDMMSLLLDATQLVSITTDNEGNRKRETDYLIVRDCRGYRYFEQKYNEEHKYDESKYVKEKSSKDVKTLKRILTDKK